MNFAEIKFPDSVAFGSSGGPEFSTNITVMKNGFEQRNINWDECRLKYNVLNGVKTKEQLNELLAFFRARKGRAIGFRFKDWSDCQAENQILGIGDGTHQEFQLVKRYVSGDEVYVRKIFKPVSGSLKVYINDTETVDYIINLKTGVLIFSHPPEENAEIKASFEFDVPVRFDSDILEISMDTINTGKVKEIGLVEVKGFER